MQIFLSTLSQTAVLFLLIAIGFLLGRLRILPEDSTKTLAKLENTVFVPCLILGTFIEHFTADRLAAFASSIFVSTLIMIAVVLIALPTARLLTKDAFERNIFTYGLVFSNFGFMGNAMVSALFPDLFLDYLIFTLPLWFLIYLWGVPSLLIADATRVQSWGDRLRALINPMFIAMLVGMFLGLLRIPIPSPVTSVIEVSGSCMSPVAMLLTGITVSRIDFKKTFTSVRIYLVSLVRLLALPLLLVLVGLVIPFDRTVYICAICSLAMPLGLNTIVIPSAYGRDTTVAAGMAIISHLLALVTIPIVFSVM